MNKPRAAATPPAQSRERVTIERTYDDVSVEDVWEMWTTAEGVEAWWGPDGFAVKVRTIDVRPGGTLFYAMTATDPPQIEFMKKAGMPLSQELRITYTEIVPLRRLAYVHLTDFIPGVAPYDVATVVELQRVAEGVRMILAFDAMHSDEWTERAVMGWNSELNKLDALILARNAGGQS